MQPGLAQNKRPAARLTGLGRSFPPLPSAPQAWASHGGVAAGVKRTTPAVCRRRNHLFQRFQINHAGLSALRLLIATASRHERSDLDAAGLSGATTIHTSQEPWPARHPSHRPSTTEGDQPPSPAPVFATQRSRPGCGSRWRQTGSFGFQLAQGCFLLRQSLGILIQGTPQRQPLAHVEVRLLMRGLVAVTAWCAGPAAFQAKHQRLHHQP